MMSRPTNNHLLEPTLYLKLDKGWPLTRIALLLVLVLMMWHVCVRAWQKFHSADSSILTGMLAVEDINNKVYFQSSNHARDTLVCPNFCFPFHVPLIYISSAFGPTSSQPSPPTAVPAAWAAAVVRLKPNEWEEAVASPFFEYLVSGVACDHKPEYKEEGEGK